MNKKRLIDSIFYPRKSFIAQDKNDILIAVEDSIKVGVRLFLNNQSSKIKYF